MNSKKTQYVAIIASLLMVNAFGLGIPLKVDFNSGSSPTQSGYTGLKPVVYSASTGLGWDKTVSSVTQKSGNDMQNDKHYSSSDATFKADIPNGNYDVRMHFYHASYYDKNGPYDKVQVYAEGELAVNEINQVGKSVVRDFRVSVSDGQLNLRFHDNGGSGSNWMICGLEVLPQASRPKITGVSGKIEQGETITIQGTMFGANGPQLFLFDDFERSSISNSASIGTWTRLNSELTTAASVSGSKSWRSSRSAGQIRFPNDEMDVFVSYFSHYPAGDALPTNWKVVWIMGNGGDGRGYHYNDLCIPALWGTGPGFNCALFCNGCPSTTYANNIFEQGKWVRYWGFYKGGFSNDGAVYQYGISPRSGHATMVTKTGFATLNSPYGRMGVNVNGYIAGGGSRQDFDDVYVAIGPNARARIEIGDQPLYEDCRNLAISTVKSWSPGQIALTLRQGSFKAGQTAYLFVVDASGKKSEGFPIKIGDTGATPGIRPVVTFSKGGSLQLNVYDMLGRRLNTAKCKAQSAKWGNGVYLSTFENGHRKTLVNR